MPSLRFSIFGSMVATLDGRPVDLGTRKQRALLALLLVDAGRTVSVDRIVDELWGDQAPAKASASLQAYVSNLRRVLEPERARGEPPSVLVTEPPGYRLVVDPGQLDAGRFAEAAAEARARLAAGDPAGALAAADDALARWSGAPFAEFADEPWAAAEVTRLDELRLTVLADRLRAMVASDQAAAAVPEIERLVGEHPLREGFWALLMLALYRSGRTAEALERYQEVRAHLAEELGLDPGPELRELEAAILRQDAMLLPPPVTVVLGAPPAAVGPSAGSVPGPPGYELVGRADEVAVIAQIVADLARPDPPWLVLEGEAGIGKSRLAEELCRRATAAGAAVAWGRAHEDHDAPGFWPWLQVLETLGGSGAAELADPTVDGDRFTRYQRVAEHLARLAETRPVVVVLDDLHWADPDSLRLLAFLAVQLHGANLSLVTTCREPGDRPELAETLATLSRRPGVVRRAIGPLAVDDIAPLADSIGAEPVTDDEARRLHERTAGNPFLVVELLRLPVDERTMALPGGVRDVVGRRLSSLPEESRTVLTVAAVIGKEFDLALLASTTGVDLDRLADLVDAAVARGIVVAGAAPDRFGFAHDLLWETVLAGVGDLRRRRLHARVADTIEALPGAADRRLSELARHRVEAGPLTGADLAVGAAVAAAERAERALAFDEAVGWYQAATGLVEADPGADPDGGRR